jgi:hypothetical protein
VVLTVMTWNVENLFRFGSPSGPQSEAAYQVKLKGLAAMIKAQAPDVLALQEVGDPAALDDLVGKLDGEWERRVSGHPDHRGIRVALLSRHPILEAADVVAFRTF